MAASCSRTSALTAAAPGESALSLSMLLSAVLMSRLAMSSAAKPYLSLSALTNCERSLSAFWRKRALLLLPISCAKLSSVMSELDESPTPPPPPPGTSGWACKLAPRLCSGLPLKADASTSSASSSSRSQSPIRALGCGRPTSLLAQDSAPAHASQGAILFTGSAVGARDYL